MIAGHTTHNIKQRKQDIVLVAWLPHSNNYIKLSLLLTKEYCGTLFRFIFIFKLNLFSF